ncbi:MAG TPA: NAD(P)-dependent oxidoreductase [Planctomycetaceae bacterium]|nr:NAD(P)-dependent oxidoreductase [Planctomycetaceae bacterium]
MSRSTALVTGGSGFIGTWVLRELLQQGMTPVVYDVRPNARRWSQVLGSDAARVIFVEGDLLETERLRQTCQQHDVQHLIHLAALLTPACQQDPWAGCKVNVLGSVALFELIRTAGLPIQGLSYASSYAVYGPEEDDGPQAGDVAQDRPPTFYGAFKLAVDLIAEQYWRHFGVASVGVRPHVVYGPERDAGLTAGPSLAAKAAAQGERYTIGYTGVVSYDYVEDVARAFVQAALETPRGAHVVDLPGNSATTEDFVREIDAAIPGAASRLSVDGPLIPSNIPPHPYYFTQLFPDWRVTPLAEGIRKTIDFYRAGRQDPGSTHQP